MLEVGKADDVFGGDCRFSLDEEAILVPVLDDVQRLQLTFLGAKYLRLVDRIEIDRPMDVDLAFELGCNLFDHLWSLLLTATQLLDDPFELFQVIGLALFHLFVLKRFILVRLPVFGKASELFVGDSMVLLISVVRICANDHLDDVALTV